MQAEYQLTRHIFIRVIGQYTLSYQDSLRDRLADRAADLHIQLEHGLVHPRLVGRQEPAAEQFPLRLPADPGTVAFVGYGNLAQNPTPVPPLGLTRQSDNLFIKFSWLFSLQ